MNNPKSWEKWTAGSGFAAIALGAAAATLERPWPSANEPAALAAFIATNHGAILAQSMLFVLSSGFYLWFLGILRSFLIRAEGGTGTLSTLAFGAGIVGSGLNVIAQAPQITLTLPAQSGMPPGFAGVLTDLCYVMTAIANIPVAVMFCAVAVVSLQTKVFPTWLGWLAALVAAASLLLSLGVTQASGPLAPQGWLSYLLYPFSVVWLIPATVVMIRQKGIIQQENAEVLATGLTQRR